jgi:N-acetyl sugar amidotransferase
MYSEIKMKYCKKCLYPDTKPQLIFNSKGICSACENAVDKEKIDWTLRREELETFLNSYKHNDGSVYDCIVPVSGGKDSTYQTYVIKEEFGLNPLAVSFHPRDFTELGRKNIEVLKNIGVDCIEFSANPIIYKKLAKFGLTELGDAAWPEHIGLFTIPVQVAVAYKIPLLIWGENPQQEYGGDKKISSQAILDKEWNEKHGGYFLDKIKPKDMVKHGISINDLKPYLYPSDEEISKLGIKGIFLGHYLKWDARKQLEVIKKIGFTVADKPCEGTYTNYENLDTRYVALHDYFKFLKYGFGRATDHVSIDIRNNRLTREEGLKLVKQYEGKIPLDNLSEFLTEMEITKEEFYEICKKFTAQEIFKKDQTGNLLYDKDNNLEKIICDNP